MSLPDTLFDATTLGGLAGCSALVWVIVSGIRTFAPLWFAKWMILAVSFLVALAARLVAGEPWTLANILILVGNAFLLALIAVGAQESAANARGTPSPATPSPAQPSGQAESAPAGGRPPVLSSWLR